MMKNFLFLIVLFLMHAVVYAQENSFVVKGKLKYVPDGTVVELTYWQGSSGRTIGTDTVSDGKFFIKAVAEKYPAYVVLKVPGNDDFYGDCEMWAKEKSVIFVRENSFYLAEWKIKNNLTEQKEWERYRRYTLAKLKERDYYDHLVATGKEKIKVQSGDITVEKLLEDPVFRRQDSLYRVVDLLELEVMARRPVNAILVWRLSEMVRHLVGERPEMCRRMKEQYERLDSSWRNTQEALNIRRVLWPPKVVKTGEQMADAEVWELNGTSHRLSDYLGKYILLDFWSSGCGPCHLAMPELEKVQEEYRDRLVVISINTDDSESMWRGGMKEHTGYLSVSDRKGASGVAAFYDMQGLPYFVVVDPTGKVIHQWTGYGEGLIYLMLKKKCGL